MILSRLKLKMKETTLVREVNQISLEICSAMAISGNMSTIWKVTRNSTTGLIQSKPYQNLTTRNAKKWKFFTIDHNHYLVVANLGHGERAEKSRVYRWDRRKRLFISFQAIWTRGAQSWEFFSIEQKSKTRDHYLIVANSGKSAGRYDHVAVCRTGWLVGSGVTSN